MKHTPVMARAGLFLFQKFSGSIGRKIGTKLQLRGSLRKRPKLRRSLFSPLSCGWMRLFRCCAIHASDHASALQLRIYHCYCQSAPLKRALLLTGKGPQLRLCSDHHASGQASVTITAILARSQARQAPKRKVLRLRSKCACRRERQRCHLPHC